MANILQVTSPSVNDNRPLIDGRDVRERADNPQIQNPSDPNRVVRADGQEQGKTGTATEEKNLNIIDYGSNYGAFVQKLAEGNRMPQLLEQLLFRNAGQLLAGGEDVGQLVNQLLSAVEVNSPEELVGFFKEQQAQQTKFSGKFFDGLRAVLSQTSSESLKEAVLSFIKGYNDYSAGRHLLAQLKSLTKDISSLMLKSYRQDFQKLADSMDWDAEEGDTSGNTAFLNDKMIPFLSSYISRTHDYGAVRDAILLFIAHAVKYENGDGDKLQQLFDRLVGDQEFLQLYKGNPHEDMSNALSVLRERNEGESFADTFSNLMLRGANGEAGLEHIQKFYDIMNGMLLNESVYLPLIHLLLPFQYEDKEVVSEAWIDPDAKRGSEDEGRKIKMFLRFNVQKLGGFELLLTMQDREVDLRLGVPPSVAQRTEEVQTEVARILRSNGLGLKRLMVGQKDEDTKIGDVFPEIRERERTINVRI